MEQALHWSVAVGLSSGLTSAFCSLALNKTTFSQRTEIAFHGDQEFGL